VDPLVEKALRRPRNLSHGELVALLSRKDATELFAAAYDLKCRHVGKTVSLRGLVELGNRCAKNCFYCGIRRGNPNVSRYRLSEDDAVRMARWSFEQGYGSVVLQSGEIESEENIGYVERILKRIRAFGGDGFGVTLCLGEQKEEVYRRWRAAGAHRYLLRIESSDPKFYAALHPADHSFARRVDCLRIVKRLGYQTGSGVMIGLPGQTVDRLARDIEFYGEMDLDMIGMGPYVPHRDTPLGKDVAFTPAYAAKQLDLGLRMVAVTRLYLHDVNIAATTALQALDGRGRERGVLAGANVMMPNVTDTAYRKNYRLYDRKPCLGENAAQCRSCLERRVLAIGEKIGWGRRGDSPHCRGKSEE
jgi:biotin synthase